MCKDINVNRTNVVESTRAAVKGFAANSNFKNVETKEDTLEKFLKEKFEENPELKNRQVPVGC